MGKHLKKTKFLEGASLSPSGKDKTSSNKLGQQKMKANADHKKHTSSFTEPQGRTLYIIHSCSINIHMY
jgi:hypothetical protein